MLSTFRVWRVRVGYAPFLAILSAFSSRVRQEGRPITGRSEEEPSKNDHLRENIDAYSRVMRSPTRAISETSFQLGEVRATKPHVAGLTQACCKDSEGPSHNHLQHRKTSADGERTLGAHTTLYIEQHCVAGR